MPCSSHWDNRFISTRLPTPKKKELDYVTRRFNASSAGLKKSVGLELRWDCRFTRSQIQGMLKVTARRVNRGTVRHQPNRRIVTALSYLAAGAAVLFAIPIEAASHRQSPAPVAAVTVQEIYALRKLPEPLVPSGGKVTAAANQRLLDALTAFESRQRSDDFSALERFLTANPQSPWRLAVETNLGILYYHAGYFSKCIPAFLNAWNTGKNASDLKAKALADRAAGEYTKMLARLGRYPELTAFLKEVESRRFVGQATELIAAGKGGAAVMKTHPERAFRCGPLALSRILASQGSPLQVAPAIVDSQSTMDGISLAAVADISRQVGLNYQPAKRSPGAALIMPSVIHWKVGHYAALIKQENGRYLTQDPTFENETWHTLEALEAEASGYFLVPPGPLPKGWSLVSAEAAAKVFGRGTTSGNNPDATKCSDKKSGGNQSSCCGMATYSLHSMLVSLNITDTPVGYDPPYGPRVDFQVTYNQREAGQPSNFNYSNLGAKWTFNALSYITDDPAVPAVASQAVAGGGTARFSAYDSATQTFAPQYDYQSVLRRTSTAPLRYEHTYPDGSKEVFALSDGSTTAPRKVFLTQQIDPVGNAVTLSYDGQFRLTQITDAIGQVTTLSYDLPGDPYKITKVTDPCGRHADFTYDGSGRLIKIHDVIGIESSFAYTGTGDFINALTTPYGTTRFTSLESGRTRRVTATDPQGDIEVLEFNEDANLQPSSDRPETLPTGMALRNSILYARNTYYWDKKAWNEYPNDYTKARLYHWQHTADYSQADNALESEKPSLENRIWYNYPGQPVGNEGATVPGSINKPSKIGRRLDDGTTQLVQFTYNSLGQVTGMTDAMGRQTLYAYETNGQDLHSVTQQTAGGLVTLGSFTWNSQHLPLTSTDAAGQTTTYTWNANGQITSVTNAKNETTTYTYYTADDVGKQRKGRLQQIDGALPGNSDLTTFDYDAYGRVASVTGPDGYYLTYTYDALDRITRVTFPDTTYTETTYLALDPQTSRDRLGRTTSYVYNSVRQLVSVTDPANRTVQYGWCACGALEQLIDPMDRITTWKHDVASRVTSKVYADGSTIAYAYEPFSGRLLSTTDEKGQVNTRGYNLDDTVASLTYTNAAIPTPNIAFTYDPDFPRVTSMTDGTGVTSYSYYPIAPGTLGAGQLSAEAVPLPNATLTYTYDQLGRRTAYAIGGVGETLSFDPIGRVLSAANPLGAFGYTYVGATSRLNGITYPNGVACSFAYQPLTGDFRLQSITHNRSGNNLLSQHSYTYDTVGNITRWTQTVPPAGINRSWSCGHDNADQLTSIASQDPSTFNNLPTGQYAYTFDVAGNRLTETLDGATTTATHNALNQLISATGGGAAALPQHTYEWDAENRLTAINYTGTNKRTELTYDGLSRCVQIIEKTGATINSTKQTVWDGFSQVEERDSTGATTKRFFGQGVQIASGASAGSYYYTGDHLGSIRVMTDSTGAVRASYDYDAFGRQTKRSGDLDSDFGFTGIYVHAPSALNLAVFRAYAPNFGRWISRDPLGARAGSNVYSYVGNNPLSYFDPAGLEGWLAEKGMDTFKDFLVKNAYDAASDNVKAGPGKDALDRAKALQDIPDNIKDAILHATLEKANTETARAIIHHLPEGPKCIVAVNKAKAQVKKGLVDPIVDPIDRQLKEGFSKLFKAPADIVNEGQKQWVDAQGKINPLASMFKK
jgi:RHS repeat-associated protein